MQQIEDTVIKTQAGTPIRIKDIAVVDQGPKIRLGQICKDLHADDDRQRRSIDNPDVVEGTVLLQKGADADPALKGIEAKVKELNDHILPKGVKVVPFLDRSDLVHLTTHTVLHNLTEGIILVVDHPDALPGQCARRHHRGAHHSVLAAVCLDLPQPEAHSGEPALAGRAGLRHGGGRRGGDGGEHRPPSESPRTTATATPQDKIREAAHEVQRPVFYAIGIIITAYLPIFTLQAVEGRLFKPMAWTVAFALLGALIFSMIVAPVLSSFFFPQGREGVAQPGRWSILTRALSDRRDLGHSSTVTFTVGIGLAGFVMAMYLLSAVIGSEFLPHLDEGAMWVRGSLAPSTGPDEAWQSPTRRGSFWPASRRPLRWSTRLAGPMTAPTGPASSIPNTLSI